MENSETGWILAHMLTAGIPPLSELLLTTDVDINHSPGETRERQKGMLMFYLAAVHIKNEKQVDIAIPSKFGKIVFMDAHTVSRLVIFGI